MLYRYIVNDDISCTSRDRPSLCDPHAHHAGDKSHRAKSEGHFLHLVGAHAKVVLLQDPVNKLLLLCAIQSDFNPLIHEKICPVLRDFLSHVEGVPLAAHHPGPVSYPVTVEPLHVALIPRLPLLHLRVELLRHGGVTKFFQFFDNVHAVTPILRNTRSKAYRVASIR